MKIRMKCARCSTKLKKQFDFNSPDGNFVAGKCGKQEDFGGLVIYCRECFTLHRVYISAKYISLAFSPIFGVKIEPLYNVTINESDEFNDEYKDYLAKHLKLKSLPEKIDVFLEGRFGRK